MSSIMWKYIDQEPQVLAGILQDTAMDKALDALGPGLEAIYFVAHGSSYNAATAAASFIGRQSGLPILRAGEAARETYRNEPLGPAQTLDGAAIEVAVNAGDADSSQRLDPSLCDGVGLFRTEFLYMGCQDYPDEETQYQAYRQVAERMQGKPVIIRTLDIGGDKALDYMGLEQEENPFLGYRAIRICLDKPAMFKTQLRAILRASAYGCVKIMFPMIVSLAEIRQSRALLAECMAELRKASVPLTRLLPWASWWKRRRRCSWRTSWRPRRTF